MDFYNRQIVGMASGSSLHSQLCSKALNMALLRRQPPTDLVHHSDRGVQYASHEYQALLVKHQLTPSMSRAGNCYDNAMVESFMHTLKVECVHQHQFTTRDAARKEIIDYIENFYNRKRKHSALDCLSPVQYEQQCQFAA